MNDVYTKLGEVHNVLNTLKQLLGLGEIEALFSTCVKELELITLTDFLVMPKIISLRNIPLYVEFKTVTYVE